MPFCTADSENTLNLQGSDTLFRFANQASRQKPFSERKVGILKDAAHSDGELVLASLAAEHRTLGRQF